MKITKTTFFLGCLVGGIGASVVPLLTTAVKADSKLLPFQGRLTDASGSAISDGAKVVEFKMYDAPTGGNVKWAGEVHKLSVNGGLVNTMLGSKASLGSVDFSTASFLQITVDANGDGQITASDPPLLPRQSVTPAVFASESGNSRLLAGSNWFTFVVTASGALSNDPSTGFISGAKIQPSSITVNQVQDSAITSAKILDGTVDFADLSATLQNGSSPVGAVIMWWGTKASIPSGWELCDGAAPTTLGATLPGSKPDLQDRFPKGATAAATDVKTAPVTGGNPNASALNLSHQHDMTHVHGSSGLRALIGRNFTVPNSTNDGQLSYIPRGGAYTDFSVGWRSWGAATFVQSSGSANATFTGAAVDGNTDGASTSVTGSGLTAPIDVRPKFLEMFYIIRVK